MENLQFSNRTNHTQTRWQQAKEIKTYEIQI